MPESMILNKPNAVAVAILKPDQKPDGLKTDDHYLWIKCFGVCVHRLFGSPWLITGSENNSG